MTDIANGKRVSATEAAEILSVPRYAISRIDRGGEIIKRYKLGHKTHVYDRDSLYAYLDACLVRPTPLPDVESNASVHARICISSPESKPSDLRKFLEKFEEFKRKEE
ncbi:MULTISPECIES: hypothetical protein [unclassified Paraburkholderia]|uniref:hypothetical protein n=1 Tax=unclassified Paraburkholderia TaxID=2615204 RepID=UPI0016083623|nr:MULTISPECIES: hypothetical protein [unclassified Paraburkholderia]MBB5446465.1 hypothetical protein [Paraburkholderia sp. WSM4177]MBB5486953.1 hypothetical protein [Paraburkholderia sp. WSM4180]